MAIPGLILSSGNLFIICCFLFGYVYLAKNYCFSNTLSVCIMNYVVEYTNWSQITVEYKDFLYFFVRYYNVLIEYILRAFWVLLLLVISYILLVFLRKLAWWKWCVRLDGETEDRHEYRRSQQRKAFPIHWN